MIAGVFALSLWARQPEYRVLYTNLSDRDGGAIISALNQMNIPYQFNDGGNAIMVPADRVHDARLQIASKGLPKGSIVGFELMENQKFGATQFQEQVNYQRGSGRRARPIDPGIIRRRIRASAPCHTQAFGVSARATEADRVRSHQSSSRSIARSFSGKRNHSPRRKQRRRTSCHGCFRTRPGRQTTKQ